MSVFWMLLLLTLLAGLAMPLGAIIASFGSAQSRAREPQFVHSVMAFGGGALLSAVALVLVPEGIAKLNPWLACASFLLGGLVFMSIDILLVRAATPASQLLAMLLDFLPESLALGAALAIGSSSAYLLATLIALQNIPEGFNAFNELTENVGHSRRKVILMFTAMAVLGPLAALTGYFWLFAYEHVLGVTLLVAAGGILYSVFQDIAPKVKVVNHWAPPMGAVVGFMLGMLGSALIAA